MEILELLKFLFIPLAVGMAGYQIHVDRGQNKKLDILAETKITEERVRSILQDKSEALHLADQISQDRLDRVEDRINKIDEKLDAIMKILLDRKY